MAISINSNFKLGSAEYVDTRMYLSAEEMLDINEDVFPDEFIVVRKGTGELYTFSKTNEVDEVTGKFRKTMMSDFPMVIYGGDAENENGNNDLGDIIP